MIEVLYLFSVFQPVGMTIKGLKDTVDTFGQTLNKFLDILFGKEVSYVTMSPCIGFQCHFDECNNILLCLFSANQETCKGG